MVAAKPVLLLTLLLTFSMHHIAAHTLPRECCNRYARRVVQHVKSFYMTPQGCLPPAVVLVTISGDTICANPKKAWVNEAILKLQRKK